MTVSATPHVNFRGRAREALEFYHSAFGGEIAVATYADIHQVDDPSDADLVSFGSVSAPNGFRIMAYDVQAAKGFDAGENPFYIALQGPETEEIQAAWDGLSEGAKVLTPLGPAPFSALYGMLTDRFGVTWIIGVMTPAEG